MTAWPTIPGFTAGVVVTEAELDALAQGLTVIGEVWPSYTPTLTGWTLGNGTLTGRYKQAGKHVRGQATFTFGSTSTTSGNLRISLPVASVAGVRWLGGANVFDTSAPARFWRHAFSSTTTEMQFATEADARVTGTVPFTWATGDQLIVDFDYEAA